MRGCFVFCLQVFPRRSPVAVGSSISVPDTVTVDPLGSGHLPFYE